MTGISIDRLIAIHKPLQYPSIVTSSRVTRINVAIWIVTILGASSGIWFVFICLNISIMCHATMYKIIRRHRLQIRSQIQAFEDRNARNITSFRKSAFNAYVLFIVLVICYCPYFVVYIVDFIGKAGNLNLGFLLSLTAVFLNSALNPLLYCWRIREIRLAVLRTFRKLVSREWETKALSFVFDKLASWTKRAMKVTRHYGLQTTSFGKLQTRPSMVHPVSVLATAP